MSLTLCWTGTFCRVPEADSALGGIKALEGVTAGSPGAMGWSEQLAGALSSCILPGLELPSRQLSHV